VAQSPEGESASFPGAATGRQFHCRSGAVFRKEDRKAVNRPTDCRPVLDGGCRRGTGCVVGSGFGIGAHPATEAQRSFGTRQNGASSASAKSAGRTRRQPSETSATRFGGRCQHPSGWRYRQVAACVDERFVSGSSSELVGRFFDGCKQGHARFVQVGPTSASRPSGFRCTNRDVWILCGPPRRLSRAAKRTGPSGPPGALHNTSNPIPLDRGCTGRQDTSGTAGAGAVLNAAAGNRGGLGTSRFGRTGRDNVRRGRQTERSCRLRGRSKPLKGEAHGRHRREIEPEGPWGERNAKRLRKPEGVAQPG
jgi:hypothetical protein